MMVGQGGHSDYKYIRKRTVTERPLETVSLEGVYDAKPEAGLRAERKIKGCFDMP